MADDEKPTDLDARIGGLATQLIEGLRGISSDPYIREGLMRSALSAVVWDLYHEYPDARDSLHDDLGSLGMAVQSAARQDGSALPSY